ASTRGEFCLFFLVRIPVALGGRRGAAPVSRKAMAFGGAIFFAALVLSYSRASAVALCVALVVLLWWHRDRVRLGRVTAIAAASIAVAALVMWRVFPGFVEMYWLRLSYTAEFLVSGQESVLSGRVASWR